MRSTRTARRTPRRRTTVTPPGRAVVLGLVVFSMLAVVFALALRSPDGVPGVDYKTVYVVLPDVGNLQKHSEVLIAGKRVGQIMRTSASGNEARVEIQLSPEAGRVPEDSTVVVRSQGLLGARYLQVRPGRSRRDVPAGGTLRPARIAITLGVPDTLQTFDRETRGGLGMMLSGLGTGLLGRGAELNEAIANSPTAARRFREVAGAVTVDPVAARRLVPELTRAAGAVDLARGDLAQMLDPANRALTPFVDRREATRATLAQAPQALDVAAPAFAEGRALLVAATRLAGSANRTLPRAPTALRLMSALLRHAREPLARVPSLLEAAREAVPPTIRMLSGVEPILRPLKQPLDDLLRPVAVLGAHGCDIANFGQVWRSFLGFGIARGGPIGPLGEIRSSALVRMPYAEAGDAARLPEEWTDHTIYPEPCEYLSKPYSATDPTK